MRRKTLLLLTIIISSLLIALILYSYLGIVIISEGVKPGPVDWWFDVNVYAVDASEDNGTPTPNLVAAVDATVLVFGFNYTGSYDPIFGWRNAKPKITLLGMSRARGVYNNGALQARARVSFTYYTPPSHYRFVVYIVAVWDGYYVVVNRTSDDRVDYYFFNGTWGALYYTVYYREWGVTIDGYKNVQEYINKINQIELNQWKNRKTGFPSYDKILRKIRESPHFDMTFAVSPHEINIYAVYPLNYTKMAGYQWPLSKTPGGRGRSGGLCYHDLDWDEVRVEGDRAVAVKVVTSKNYAYPIFLFEGHTIANSTLGGKILAGASGRYTTTGGVGVGSTVSGVDAEVKSFGGKTITWVTGTGGMLSAGGEDDWINAWTVGKLHVEVLYVEIFVYNELAAFPYIDLNPRWSFKHGARQSYDSYLSQYFCRPVWMIILSLDPNEGDAHHPKRYQVNVSQHWKLLEGGWSRDLRLPFTELSNCSVSCPEACRSYSYDRGTWVSGQNGITSIEWRSFNITLTATLTVKGATIESQINISVEYWYAENRLMRNLVEVVTCFRDSQSTMNKTVYVVGSAEIDRYDPWQGRAEVVCEEGPLIKPSHISMKAAAWQVVLWYIEDSG